MCVCVFYLAISRLSHVFPRLAFYQRPVLSYANVVELE